MFWFQSVQTVKSNVNLFVGDFAFVTDCVIIAISEAIQERGYTKTVRWTAGPTFPTRNPSPGADEAGTAAG